MPPVINRTVRFYYKSPEATRCSTTAVKVMASSWETAVSLGLREIARNPRLIPEGATVEKIVPVEG